MQVVVTEGQFFGNDNPLHHIPPTFDAALHWLKPEVALAFAFKKLTAFQVDSIPRFRGGKWSRQSKLEPQGTAVHSDDYRLNGALHQKLPALAQRAGKIIHAFHRRTQSVEDAKNGFGRRLHQTPQAVVKINLNVEETSDVVQQVRFSHLARLDSSGLTICKIPATGTSTQLGRLFSS